MIYNASSLLIFVQASEHAAPTQRASARTILIVRPYNIQFMHWRYPESNLVFLKFFIYLPHNLPLRKPYQHTIKFGCFLTLHKKTTAVDLCQALHYKRKASFYYRGRALAYIHSSRGWVRFQFSILGAVEFVSQPLPITIIPP